MINHNSSPSQYIKVVSFNNVKAYTFFFLQPAIALPTSSIKTWHTSHTGPLHAKKKLIIKTTTTCAHRHTGAELSFPELLRKSKSRRAARHLRISTYRKRFAWQRSHTARRKKKPPARIESLMYNRAKRHRTAHTTAKTSLSLNGQAHASVCLFLSASCSPLGGIDHAFESSRARVARRGFATAITFRDGRCTHSLSLSLSLSSLAPCPQQSRAWEMAAAVAGGFAKERRERERREN